MRTPFDPELSPGAQQRGARVPAHPAARESHADHRPRLRGDRGGTARRARSRRRAVHAFVLEDWRRGRWQTCPARSLDDMETSQVSIFAVQAQANELRHAHADDRRRQPAQDASRAHGEHRRARSCSRACAPTSTRSIGSAPRCWNRRGARRRFAPRRRPAPKSRPSSNPTIRWIKTSGIISPEKWGNLPGGEIFTTPGEVNGTFVIDGVVGD